SEMYYRNREVAGRFGGRLSGKGTVSLRPDNPLLSLEGPVAQWLEPAAHNGLVAGSSPAGPTTFTATPDEPNSDRSFHRRRRKKPLRQVRRASGFEVPKTDLPSNDAVLPSDRNRPL